MPRKPKPEPKPEPEPEPKPKPEAVRRKRRQFRTTLADQTFESLAWLMDHGPYASQAAVIDAAVAALRRAVEAERRR